MLKFGSRVSHLSVIQILESMTLLLGSISDDKSQIIEKQFKE